MTVSPFDPLVLVVLGVLSGYAHRRVLVRHNEDWHAVLFVATVGLFWLDLLAASVGGVDPRVVLPAVRTDSIALTVLYPLSYPFWYLAGSEFVFVLLGRRPDQGGVLWLYRVGDRTDDFESAWDP